MEKKLILIQYFEQVVNNQLPQIIYHIEYTITEYKPNKFCFKVDIIEHNGYYPSSKVYCFDEIKTISIYKNGLSKIVCVGFIIYPYFLSEYKITFHTDEDANKLYQFLMDNLIYKN